MTRCHNCRLREATVPVRIYGSGSPLDREVCYVCFDALQTMGMDIRRSDGVGFIPEWRRRSLRAKDLTGGAA